MESYKICRAEPRDIEGVKFVETESRLSPWPIAAYESELGRVDSVLLTARDDENRVVGFIAGRVPREAGADAEILNIGVLPVHRRHGIGRKLLESFLDECHARAVASVWLEVRTGNQAAISFYKRCGFESRGNRPNFYSNPTEDATLMCLSLR